MPETLREVSAEEMVIVQITPRLVALIPGDARNVLFMRVAAEVLTEKIIARARIRVEMRVFICIDPFLF